MSIEDLQNIVKTLKEKSFDFKLDTYINVGKSNFRGIFIFDKNEREIKNTISNGLMKEFKVKKSYMWYLGEKKKAMVLKPKKELIMEIHEAENFNINNYA